MLELVSGDSVLLEGDQVANAGQQPPDVGELVLSEPKSCRTSTSWLSASLRRCAAGDRRSKQVAVTVR